MGKLTVTIKVFNSEYPCDDILYHQSSAATPAEAITDIIKAAGRLAGEYNMAILVYPANKPAGLPADGLPDGMADGMAGSQEGEVEVG